MKQSTSVIQQRPYLSIRLVKTNEPYLPAPLYPRPRPTPSPCHSDPRRQYSIYQNNAKCESTVGYVSLSLHNSLTDLIPSQAHRRLYPVSSHLDSGYYQTTANAAEPPPPTAALTAGHRHPQLHRDRGTAQSTTAPVLDRAPDPLPRLCSYSATNGTSTIRPAHQAARPHRPSWSSSPSSAQ